MVATNIVLITVHIWGAPLLVLCSWSIFCPILVSSLITRLVFMLVIVPGCGEQNKLGFTQTRLHPEFYLPRPSGSGLKVWGGGGGGWWVGGVNQL